LESLSRDIQTGETMENVKNNVFSMTRLSIDKFINMFETKNTSAEKELELFVKNEYKDDWQWALAYYRDFKVFPRNYIK